MYLITITDASINVNFIFTIWIRISTMSEQSPLVHVNVHHKCFSKLKYRLICIKSRVAILVLLLDLLFQAYKRYTVYFLVVVSGLLSLHEAAIYLLAAILFVIPFLFYPVGGLIADVRIGRYRMIVISGYICLLSLDINYTGTYMMNCMFLLL